MNPKKPKVRLWSVLTALTAILTIAAIVGILLNAILPGNDYEFDSADGADAPSSGNLQV